MNGRLAASTKEGFKPVAILAKHGGIDLARNGFKAGPVMQRGTAWVAFIECTCW